MHPLEQLLGHNDAATTMIYTHVLRWGEGMRGPRHFPLELTRGPFLGTEEVNCMAARRPHIAPSEASSVAAASVPRWGRRWRPARSSAGAFTGRKRCSSPVMFNM
jgi:hypothetical protein